MKKILSIVLLLLPATFQVSAQDLPAASVRPSVTVNGKSLQLNDVCARRKFVIDNCVGQLYTPKPASSEEEVLAEPGDKLLRLDILQDKFEKEKLMGAFEEGFMNYAPDVARSPDAKKFLTLFKVDFYKGDRVDLFLGGDGTVAASRNGQELGKLKSPPLARGILKSWFGKKPPAETLQEKTPGK